MVWPAMPRELEASTFIYELNRHPYLWTQVGRRGRWVLNTLPYHGPASLFRNTSRLHVCEMNSNPTALYLAPCLCCLDIFLHSTAYHQNPAYRSISTCQHVYSTFHLCAVEHVSPLCFSIPGCSCQLRKGCTPVERSRLL